jgi:hypothetical protein
MTTRSRSKARLRSRAGDSPIRLYAVVPAEEASALQATTPRLRTTACGPVAAVFGRPPELHDDDPGMSPTTPGSPRRGTGDVRAALDHGRIVSHVFEVCSSVIPFRLGVELESETGLRVLLDNEAPRLGDQLTRFRGRVEMGLKMRLGTAQGPLRLPIGLDRVRALAKEPVDRREGLTQDARGRIFEGCYLISRQAVEDYWRALEQIRRRTRALPLLGSGPWAAYSFCDGPPLKASR